MPWHIRAAFPRLNVHSRVILYARPIVAVLKNERLTVISEQFAFVVAPRMRISRAKEKEMHFLESPSSGMSRLISESIIFQ